LDFIFTNGSVNTFKGGIIESSGTWQLTETGMKITCTMGDPDCNKPLDVTVEYRNSTLRITNKGAPSFLWVNCEKPGQDFTEVFVSAN